MCLVLHDLLDILGTPVMKPLTLGATLRPARSRCSMTMTSTLNSFATVMMKPAVLTAMSLLTPFALAQSLGMRFAPLL